MRKLLVLAFACLPFAAAAQPAPADPEWAQIETVQSDAPQGPALWHVTRGESEVWLLGTVGTMPKNLSWNRQYIAELLDGAKAVLTPPGASVGIGEGVWLLINYGGRLSLPRGQSLEAIMAPDMRARFVALRDSLSRDEDRYRTDVPFRAIGRINADFRDKRGLTGDAWRAIRELADDKDVPVKTAGKNASAYDLVKDILTLPMDKQLVCLDQSLHEITWLSGHAEAAAQAWAVGDLHTLKANLSDYPSTMDCMSAHLTSVAATRERLMAMYVDAIDAALNQKGKTIILTGMSELLRKGGVLERLKAKGLTIEGPAE